MSNIVSGKDQSHIFVPSSDENWNFRIQDFGKQEFRRTDFGSRLLAGERGGGSEGEGYV